MAKKKTETPEVENPTELENAVETHETPATEGVENSSTEETQAPATPANEEEQAPAKTATKKAKESKANTDIPQSVQKILKSFPNEKALYIDTFGGVFTADTKLSEIGTAILYQNPYYKS